MITKSLPALTMFLASLGCLTGLSAHASDAEIVEIPIRQVFIPSVGFDDNDTVEAVVDSELKNICYSLSYQTVDVNKETKVITLKQYAIRQTSGTCKQGSEPNVPEIVTPIPFTETVSLGRLEMGDYQIHYRNSQNQEQSRPFSVATSPVPTMDSIPYAMVTEVKVSDFVASDRDVVVTVQGILNNSCYSLNEQVGLQKLGDVMVIMPTIHIARQAACLMVTTPFSVDVNVGKMTQEGRYLVHVRSMHGKSFNRVFSGSGRPSSH